MTMMPVLETHIFLDERGKAWVKRAGVSVKQLVVSLKQCDFRPDEVVRAFPHLRLSEVHAVLAYYYDHRTEIDRALADDEAYLKQARADHVESPIEKRVRAAMQKAGKIP